MATRRSGRILIVDDEPDSNAVQGLAAVLEEADWTPWVVRPRTDRLNQRAIGDAYDAAAMEAVTSAMEGGAPPLEAVVLDLEFGSEPLKGVDILRRLLAGYPSLPVLVLTKHSQGPYRRTGVQESFKAGAKVEYVDKLASAEEVVLRLRRLIGRAREPLVIADKVSVDYENRTIHVKAAGKWQELQGFDGSKFEVFRDLVAAYIRHPDTVVPYERLFVYYESESLRVRVSEINQALKSYGLGAVRPKRKLGYRLVLSR